MIQNQKGQGEVITTRKFEIRARLKKQKLDNQLNT